MDKRNHYAIAVWEPIHTCVYVCNSGPYVPRHTYQQCMCLLFNRYCKVVQYMSQNVYTENVFT